MTHRYQKTLFLLLTFLLVGFSWLGGSRPVAEANVTLLSFDVARSATNPENRLIVTWETATETDMVGFRIRRSTTANVQEATTVATQPRAGTATSGATYEWTDEGLTTGQTYYYWLYELKDTGTEELITPNPESETPGSESSPTSTPTVIATQIPTTTPTEIGTEKTPTNTPTVPRVAGPSATPTTPAAQATDTPVGDAPTPQPTNTSVPVAQGQPTNTSVPVAQVQATNTPVVSVPTPIVEGATPNPDLATPVVEAGATAETGLQGSVAPTDQTLQVPPTPTLVLDAAAASGTASDVTPTSETTDPTPQAVAQEAASGSAPSTERLARPTATPRPAASDESGSDSGSLLLILGGASLFGAVLLALAALVIWRRR